MSAFFVYTTNSRGCISIKLLDCVKSQAKTRCFHDEVHNLQALCLKTDQNLNCQQVLVP